MVELDSETRERMSRALEAVCRHVRPAAAYLFGSRAEGRGDAWSDYDLALFVEGAETWDLPRRARFCAVLQREAGDDIEFHLFAADRAVAPEPASFAAHVLTTGVQLPLQGQPGA